MKSDNTIFTEQMNFFRSGKAGCIFGALAATDPVKYHWHQVVCQVDTTLIDNTLEHYIANSEVSTISLIFPKVVTVSDLLDLIKTLESCRFIETEKTYYQNFLCYGFRAKVADKLSWVAGFAPFDFLPKTRQAPYTEITCRVKDKPNYAYEIKKTPENTLHVANMEIKGMSKDSFHNLWNQSLLNTEKILGHKADFLSAAKTSFIIPKEYVCNLKLNN